MTRRAAVATLAPVLLAAALAAGLGMVRAADAEDAATAEVARRDLVTGIEVEGEVEAVDPAILGPPAVSGIWNYRIAFMVPEGSEVRAGQPVLRFDTQELERRLVERQADRDSADTQIEKRRTDLAKRREQVELELAEAKANLRRADLQLETPEELMAANELAEQRIDRDLARAQIDHLNERLELLDRQSEAEIGMLEERRTAAAARVAALQEDLRRMTVAAPRDGIVIYDSDWQGEKPKVGDEVWVGRTVLEIPDLGRLLGSGTVAEADLAQIETGQPVAFRLDAHPDVRYRGRIAEIGRTAQRRSPRDPRRVVRVEIALDGSDPERLRPGLRFQGEVEVDRVEDVLTVPADAVVSTADGPVVFRRTLWGAEPVRPELGRVASDLVEVVAGLEAGDRVLLEPPEEEGP